MLLGDEFWLVAHDENTGRPKLSARVLGLGLAAALLGELVYYRSITIQNGYIYAAGHAPPQDAVARTVLEQITGEGHPYTIRTWLVFLSRHAEETVTHRMWRAGFLRQQSSRRLLRQVTTYAPVDPGKAAWPMARLSTTLRRQSPMEHSDAFLAGVVLATGLDQVMLDGAGAGPHEYLAHVVAGLAAPLHQLVVHTQAAVGDAVLSQRA